MEMRDEEIKYSEVVGTLKQLQKVKAPQYFEADLMRRINAGEFRKDERVSAWKKFFLPSRLIPSAGLAAAAVFFLFILNTGEVDLDNPLLSDPRVREDVTAGTAASMPSLTERLSSRQKTNNGFNEEEARASAVSSIKQGLNFRQIQLSDEEQVKLKQLRERIMNILNSGQK